MKTDFAVQHWAHMLDEAMDDKAAARVDETEYLGVLYDRYEALMSDTSVPNYLRTKRLCDDRAEYLENVLADLDAGEDREAWIEMETDQADLKDALRKYRTFNVMCSLPAGGSAEVKLTGDDLPLKFTQADFRLAVRRKHANAVPDFAEMTLDYMGDYTFFFSFDSGLFDDLDWREQLDGWCVMTKDVRNRPEEIYRYIELDANGDCARYIVPGDPDLKDGARMA